MIELRAAQVADAGPLLVVQRSAYLAEAQRYAALDIPPLVETLAEVVAAIEAGGVVVAVEESRVVGSVRWVLTEGVCHVGRLSVADDLQGQGIGSRLIAAVETATAAAGVESYTLFTGANSPYNIRLYERHGYVVTHHERLNDRVTFAHMSKPGVTPAGSA